MKLPQTNAEPAPCCGQAPVWAMIGPAACCSTTAASHDPRQPHPGLLGAVRGVQPSADPLVIYKHMRQGPCHSDSQTLPLLMLRAGSLLTTRMASPPAELTMYMAPSDQKAMASSVSQVGEWHSL